MAAPDADALVARLSKWSYQNGATARGRGARPRGLLRGTPHVAFDVVYAIDKGAGRAACAADTTRLDATHTAEGKTIVMNRPTRRRGTPTRLSPAAIASCSRRRCAGARTRVQDAQGYEHDLAPILYKHRGETFAALSGRDRLHEVVHAQVGVAPDKWVTSTVAYLDASVVAEAVAMLVTASSEAQTLARASVWVLCCVNGSAMRTLSVVVDDFSELNWTSDPEPPPAP